jgi:hypothetical protein
MEVILIDNLFICDTVKIQTPDHLETVVLTKTLAICWSEISITLVIVCKFLQKSGKFLVRTFYGFMVRSWLVRGPVFHCTSLKRRSSYDCKESRYSNPTGF